VGVRAVSGASPPAGLPFSEACERNKEPILAKLRAHLDAPGRVLEVGGGTGQHAVHFAHAMPWLEWQATEREAALATLRPWLAAMPAPNLLAPCALDVHGEWPQGEWDAVYTANTLHIMGWEGVQAFFAGAGRALGARGLLLVYGPFNYAGTWTSDSNRDFDRLLRSRDPASGLRDVEAVHALAAAQGLAPVADHAMPANNRLLVWRRR
jgi:cyclopropane fatty-acyl-phospholipid synthase-like methyltransferase